MTSGQWNGLELIPRINLLNLMHKTSHVPAYPRVMVPRIYQVLEMKISGISDE